jgi:hypothetical protein
LLKGKGGADPLVDEIGDVEIAAAWFFVVTGDNDIGESGDEEELGFV